MFSVIQRTTEERGDVTSSHYTSHGRILLLILQYLVKHELKLNKLACLRNNVQPDTSLMCAKTLGNVCRNYDQYSLMQHH